MRALVRDILVYGSGDLVLRASSLLTLPIYSRLLGPDEFGVWSFLVAFTFLLNVVLTLGIDAAYARYFFAAKEHADRAELTTTAIAFVGTASTLAAVVLLPLSASISEWSFGTDEHADLVAIAIASGPVTVVSTLLGQVLRNEFRAKLFAVLNGLAAVLGVTVSLVLVVAFDLGVKGVLAGTLVGAAAVLPLRLWAARAHLGRLISRATARRLATFGLPLVPAAIAGWVMSVSDRIVLGKLASFRDVGLYAVAASIASVLSFLLGPLGQAWTPHALQAYERDRAEAALFYGRVLTYILLGFGALAVAVSAFAPELVALLTPDSFGGAERAVAPLALGAVAFATIQITSAAISLVHRTRLIGAMSLLAAAVNLALNIALVPPFGLVGAAWASAATSVGLTLGYAVLARRFWRVRYETHRVLALSATIAVFTVGAGVLPELGVAAAVPAKLAYCAAFVVVLYAARAVDERETRALRAFVRLRSSRQ